MAEDATPGGQAGDRAADATENRPELVSARRVLLGALRRAPRQRAGRKETEQMPAGPEELSRFDRPGSEPSPCPLTDADPAAEILRNAEGLGVPWKRILIDEIQSEQRLRRHVVDIDKNCSLSTILTILAFSCLRSWRARDQMERLSQQARRLASREAIRQIGNVFFELVGRRTLRAE
jgi:hypothetical protein